MGTSNTIMIQLFRIFILGISVLMLNARISYSQEFDSKVQKLDSITKQRLDSIKIPDPHKLLSAADTISFDELDKIDSAIQHTSGKIDSLQSLKLPTEKYTRKLDSLSARLKSKVANDKADSVAGEFKTKIKAGQKRADSLQQIVSDRKAKLQKSIDQKLSFRDSLNINNDPTGVSKLGSNPLTGVNSQLPQINTSMPGFDETKTNLNGASLPAKDLPSVQMPKVPQEINEAQNKINELQNFPKEKLNDIGIGDDIAKVKSQIQEVETVTKKAQEYKDDIKEISEGNLEKTKAIPQELEKQVLKIDEVKAFQTEGQKFETTKNALQQYQTMMASMNDKKALEENAKELAQGKLQDPFAGQEAKLKNGIAQLDKLKMKYKSIPDSRYLPKRVPNEMKGKPFRERIIPGTSLQFYKGDNFAIDFSPYVSYKLSKRFRPGVGVTFREEFNKKSPFLKKQGVYGYRIMNDFRWFGNFYLHTEGEWLHFTEEANARYKFPADEEEGPWHFRLNTGLFKTYKISKRLDGQMQILYNVLDLTRFPQTKNTSFRFGVEYKFKEGRKKDK